MRSALFSNHFLKEALLVGAYFKIDQLYQQLHQKHFKSTYAGKPTKKFIAIAEAITKLKQTNYQSLF